jgi:hypothetical protein
MTAIFTGNAYSNISYSYRRGSGILRKVMLRYYLAVVMILAGNL